MRTLVVHCHPDPESFNAALYRAACEEIRSAGHELRSIDLYAEGFNPVLDREERQAYLEDTQRIVDKVQAHVEALRWAQHLIFVYPTWFYGPPAMLKGWLERVWLPGVAFLPASVKGRRAESGLRHIERMTVVTHGGSPWWWLKVMGDPGQRLFMRGLRVLFAKKCKSVWLQLHDMNTVSLAEREAFLAKVRRALRAA